MKIAITGFASLDHVAMLDGVPIPGRTTTILDRPDGAWPRLGGSPAYVAAALALGGVTEAIPVSWIGDDEAGRDYRRTLCKNGVSDRGLAVVDGARTPVAILAYEPAGGCICLYHPGIPKRLTLSRAQITLLDSVDWLCITVGPQCATAAALDALGPSARLAWVVKDDPEALPKALAARIATRADLICHSRAEAAFVAGVLEASGPGKPGRILIETKGGAGASAMRGSETVFVGAKPIDIADPTGAGDTFAGGALAALALGETALAPIVEAGHQAARKLLETRRIQPNESA